MVCQRQSLVIEKSIFVIVWLKLWYRNMAWLIVFSQLIIRKQVATQKYPTEKSSPYLKRHWILIEKIGIYNLMMHFGPTVEHKNTHGMSSYSLIYRKSCYLPIELEHRHSGQLSSTICWWMKLDNKGKWYNINWKNVIYKQKTKSMPRTLYNGQNYFCSFYI